MNKYSVLLGYGSMSLFYDILTLEDEDTMLL